jgi:hypothetical protein
MFSVSMEYGICRQVSGTQIITPNGRHKSRGNLQIYQ